MIRSILWDGPDTTAHRLTPSEIVQLRSKYRDRAHIALKLTGAAHVLYYRDERNEADEITTAHFYPNMEPMSDEKFYTWTEKYTGFVGAVHALT